MIPVVLGAVVSVTVVVWKDCRDPAKTLAWLFVLALLPGLGFLLYMVFGRSAHKTFADKHFDNPDLYCDVRSQQDWLGKTRVFSDPEGKKLAQLLLRNSCSPLTRADVQVLTNGREKFPELFRQLKQAKHHIHMEYYIFRDDALGQEILRVLRRKRREGLEVRLLLDGVGSHSLPRSLFQTLVSEGIKIAYFEPVRFPYLTSRLNFRNHRKIVVIDGEVAFLGGLNIGDEYLSHDPNFGFWRDTHLRVYGAIVQQVQAAFAHDWFYATGETFTGPDYYPETTLKGSIPAQILASGPEKEWQTAFQLFFVLLSMADESIYIETPYSIPNESMMTVLQTAAISGLDVRLIVQGIPDHQITYWAARAYFQPLLTAGVKIYAYQKGILHSKVVLVDGKYASVGSANFDVRSFKLNYELSAILYDQESTARLELDFRQDQRDSEEIFAKAFSERPWQNKAKETLAMLFSPLL